MLDGKSPEGYGRGRGVVRGAVLARGTAPALGIAHEHDPAFLGGSVRERFGRSSVCVQFFHPAHGVEHLLLHHPLDRETSRRPGETPVRDVVEQAEGLPREPDAIGRGAGRALERPGGHQRSRTVPAVDDPRRKFEDAGAAVPARLGFLRSLSSSHAFNSELVPLEAAAANERPERWCFRVTRADVGIHVSRHANFPDGEVPVGRGGHGNRRDLADGFPGGSGTHPGRPA